MTDMIHSTNEEGLRAENDYLRQHVESLQTRLTHTTQQLDHAARTEEALRASEERLRTIIERNADAMLVTNNGIVLFVNPAAESLFQRSTDELLNKEIGIPFVANDKVEVDILTKEGTRQVAEMRVVEIVWGGETANLSSFRDVTERKQLEEELEQRVSERTTMLRHTLQQLSIELEEREKTEKALLRRDAILEAIEFAAHRFLKSTCYDQEIPRVLEYMGKATLTSRVAMFTVNDDQAIQLYRHLNVPTPSSKPLPNTEGAEKEAPAELGHPGSRNFMRWQEYLSRGFSIHGDVRTFPPEERATLEHEHVQSLVVVPIFVEHEWWGFIEFDESRVGRAWLLAEVEALRTAASMIGTALQHGRLMEALRESEERFRTVAEFTNDWEYWISPEGRYLYVSPSCERITGYRPDAFLDDPDLLERISHPADRALVAAHMQHETEPGGGAEALRFRILTPHGTERWIGHVCQPVNDSQGHWLGRRGSNRDITEQVHIEESLKQEQRLFVGGPVVVFKWSAEAGWPVEYVSPNVTQFGYQPEDFTSGRIPYTSLVHPDDRQRIATETAGHATGHEPCFEQDYRIIRADGTVRWVYNLTQVLRAAGQRPTHYQGYILDITDRKEAEEALRQSEEQFRAFIEGTDDVIIQVNETGILTYANHVAQRMCSDSCIGHSLFDFVHPEDRQRTRMAFEGWIRNRATSVTFENRLIALDQSTHHMHWVINLAYDHEGQITTINGIARDLTDNKRVEQALRESETRYRIISELISDFAYSLRIEPDGTFALEWVTDAFEHTTGYTMREVEANGGFVSLIYEKDRPTFYQSCQALLDGKRSDEYEFRIVTRRGDMCWLRNHSRPLWNKAERRVAHIYGGMRDVTEWKQAMEAMQERDLIFRHFLQRSQEALVLMNNLGFIIEWNQGAEYIWGQTQMDVMGLALWDVIFDALPQEQQTDDYYEEVKTATQTLLKESPAGPHQEWIPQHIQLSDGRQRLLESLFFPIETSKGTLFGGIMYDRTQQQHTEQALRRLQDGLGYQGEGESP